MSLRASLGRASLSRALTLALAVASDLTIPDHVATDVASEQVPYSSALSKTLLSPFTKWDSAHFLRIARQGYVEDLDFAFFPLLPLVSKALGSLVHVLLPSLKATETHIVAAVMLNNLAFILTAVVVHHISLQLHCSPSCAKLAMTLFCFNPASVFFSTVYTESLYSLFSFTGVWVLGTRMWFLAFLPFLVASCARSNGTTNCIFVAFHGISALANPRHGAARKCAIVIFDALQCIAIISPFVAHNLVGYHMLCTDHLYARSHHWCKAFLPQVYSYVQAKYWNVGLFRYYQWKQIPNFILAIPTLLSALFIVIKELKRAMKITNSKRRESEPRLKISNRQGLRDSLNRAIQWVAVRLQDENRFPHAIHLLFLSMFALFFINIQVSTRLLFSSCPILYVGLAEMLHIKDSDSRIHRGIILFFVLYNILGVVLHPNFFPWT